MTHDEMVALVRAGVVVDGFKSGGIWADLGCGKGNFTRVLRDLLGEEATLYAVDRDAPALDLLGKRWPPGDTTLHLIQADFTQPLDLPLLDGILMANALHFIPRQRNVLQRVGAYLPAGGCLLLVEYDVQTPHSFIPYPVPFSHFAALAQDAGFMNPLRVGLRRSPTTGMSMYAGSAIKR